MQTNFYLSRLSEVDIQRIADLLPRVGDVALDLAHALAHELDREIRRRRHNDDPNKSPIGPEPLAINAIGWNDEQIADAMRAAALMAVTLRVESAPVAALGDWVLLCCVGYITSRLSQRSAMAEYEAFNARLLEMNRDLEFVAVH